MDCRLVRADTDRCLWKIGAVPISILAAWRDGGAHSSQRLPALRHDGEARCVSYRRLFPIFHSLELWFWLVCGVGFFTMLLGAFLALRSNDLKAILAYSTVSQLGFLIGAYGVGSKTAFRPIRSIS